MSYHTIGIFPRCQSLLLINFVAKLRKNQWIRPKGNKKTIIFAKDMIGGLDGILSPL